MIEVRNLCVNYDDKKVLQHLDAQFDEGSVHGIIGLNGAGKTTFFNTLARFFQPAEGAITRKGSPLNRNDLGFLETNNFFYSGLTGNDYLGIFEHTNKQFDLDAFQELMQLPLNQLTETYSTGMKKKLALLAVLKQEKDIYLFDEPFNGLDMESNKVVEIVLEKLREKGKTIFISSHILHPLTNTCDLIHLLADGSLKKVYGQAVFHEIEHDLFSNFTDRAQQILSSAL